MVHILISLFFLFTGRLSSGAETKFNRDCLPAVLKFIQGTKKQLLISVFDINENEIVDAILEKYAEGKEIRIISDKRQGGSPHSALPIFHLMGMNVILASKGKIHHHKYAVSDGKSSVNGSFNWTEGAANSNKEDLVLLKAGLILRSENQAINDLKNQFEADWEINTREKSDGYFNTSIKKNRKELIGKWEGWIKERLTNPNANDKVTAKKVEMALRLANGLKIKDAELAELAAPLIQQPGRQFKAIRELANETVRLYDPKDARLKTNDGIMGKLKNIVDLCTAVIKGIWEATPEKFK